MNNDPQQNTTSENLSNESADSDSGSRGGAVEASSNDNTVSSDDQKPESDVSDKQSNDVNVNEASDESNSDAAESGVYQVNDQSTFEDALNKIAFDNLSEIRLVLKGGSSFEVPTHDYVSTFGVANKKITVTSDGDNRAILHFSNRAMLSGSCTFDNVEVVGSGKFYCNGFDTVFTRNCELNLSETLYGGGYKSTVDHTHVVIAASGYINPGNYAGLHDVIGGSYQGSVEHDTYLEISGNLGMTSGNHVNPGCMRGDGSSGDGKGSPSVYVGGNATLVYDNANCEVSPSIEGTYGCEMRGNVTLDVRSGETLEICGTEGDASESIIDGNLHIIAGSESYANSDRILRLGANWGITGAGNLFAASPGQTEHYIIKGSVTIDTFENVWGWDKGTVPDSYDLPNINGAIRGKVGGDITINVQGSHLQDIYGASKDSSVSGTVTINTINAELKNSLYGDPEYDEGDILALSSSTAGGACKVLVDGGDVNIIRLTNATLANEGSEITVSGSPKVRTGILSTANYDSAPLNAPTVNFNNCSATIPFVQSATNVYVKNDSRVTLNGLWLTMNLTVEKDSSLVTDDNAAVTLEGNAVINGSWEQLYDRAASGKPDLTVAGSLTVGQGGQFVNHGSMSVVKDASNSGLMALLKPVIIQGSYDGVSAEVRLPIVSEGKNYNVGSIPLDIRGVASGVTTVNTVDASDWKILKKPTIGDNYVLGKAGAKDTPAQGTFVLGNSDALNEGMYLKRTNDAAGNKNNFMWQVAAKIDLTFDANGADDPAYPLVKTQEKIKGKNSYTFALPKTAPTRKGWAFDGWNTERDGSGDQFTDKTEVSKSTTVYAQWKWVPRDVTVTFDENGGETKADPASQTKTTEPGALASTGERLLPVLPLAVVGSALTSLGLLLEYNRKKRRNDK